jgi:integrase
MRQPKPFYKQSHKAWYVERNGKQVRLIQGDKAATEADAWQEYYRLMAGEIPTTSKTTVAEIVHQFLAWVEINRAPATHEWYVKYLAKSPKTAKVRRTFLDYIGERKLVSDLKPVNVNRWLDDRWQDASDNYKNCACRAVATCFNWATDLQILEKNPVKGFKRPAPQPRDCYLTPNQWKQLIGSVKGDDPFADLLWFLHQTGARPQEARILTAKHFDKAGRRLVLERNNSKGKKVRRVIRLNERAFAIVKRLALKHPEGALCRQALGDAVLK